MRTPQEVVDIVNALPAVAAVRRATARAHQPIYFTGSGLRDVFLGRAPQHFDFIVGDGAERVAREVATGDPNGSLDIDRESQVASYSSAALGQLRFLPANGLTGDECVARFADFTVDAAGLDVATGTVFDWHGSLGDLARQTVRSLAPATLADRDPHLALRAVRLALLTPEFTIEAKTSAAIRALARSMERSDLAEIGYALSSILSCPSHVRGVGLLDEFGLLETVLRRIRLPVMARAPWRTRVGRRIDLPYLVSLFRCHGKLWRGLAPKLWRYAGVARHVLFAGAVQRACGASLDMDDDIRSLRVYGERLERAFEPLAAKYSPHGIAAFRVRMLTVGLWTGARSLRRGASIEEACEQAYRTFGAWKGALSASLIGAQWLAGQPDGTRQRDIERVVSALARWSAVESSAEARVTPALDSGQPVRLQERRP